MLSFLRTIPLLRSALRFPKAQEAGSVQENKAALIREIGAAQSVRDYGGLWGVNGQYLEEAVRILRCQRAWMIDSLATKEWQQKEQELRETFPHCQIVTTVADFREHAIFLDMEPSEVSLLFDVLLHEDTAVEVIKDVCAKTLKYVCVAQPVLNETLFRLPNACVNLQFLPAKLKEELRCGYNGWPREPEVDYFEPAVWIWGHTPSYLRSVFYGYGWTAVSSTIVPISEYLAYAFIRFASKTESK